MTARRAADNCSTLCAYLGRCYLGKRDPLIATFYEKIREVGQLALPAALACRDLGRAVVLQNSHAVGNLSLGIVQECKYLQQDVRREQLLRVQMDGPKKPTFQLRFVPWLTIGADTKAMKVAQPANFAVVFQHMPLKDVKDQKGEREGAFVRKSNCCNLGC